MVMPETLDDYTAILIRGMVRHLAATPAIDYAVLTVHDNDMRPVSTHRIVARDGVVSVRRMP